MALSAEQQTTTERASDGQRSPLIVDLDGTLILSDSLMEGIAAGLFQKPGATLVRTAMAPLSRSRFKAWVFSEVVVDYDAIPANEDLVAFLQAERAAGRSIHLVSAAHQGVVEQIAERFGLFDSAHGSSSDTNLKGARKLAFIRERFGDEFTYVGDSRPDLKVWESATGAIYAGTNGGIANRLAAQRRSEFHDLTRTGGGVRAWMKALRLHQWAKNLLLFIPLVLAHMYTDPQAILAATLAFVCMGLTASGTYLVNDLADLSSDRRHRTKKRRPFAAGRVGVAEGIVVAFGLIAAGLTAAFLLNIWFGAVLSVYLVLTLAYSMKLKRTPIVDIFILAGLYTLRIIMGTVVIGAAFSQWLLTFSMFFFFSLSLAKRHVEVADPGAAPDRAVKGRGYYPDDAPFTLALGIGSAACSILILVLYLVDEAYEVDVYRGPAFLALIPIVIGMWVARIWMLAHRGHLHDDPVLFAVKDAKSIAMGIALVAIMAAASLVSVPQAFS